MHLKQVKIDLDNFPSHDRYPFHLKVFQQRDTYSFDSPVTFFIGDNGTGKSTLLEALAEKCGIHIWRNEGAISRRGSCKITGQMMAYDNSGELYSHIKVEWTHDKVPGSYFAGEIFQHFTQFLEEWAASDVNILNYFGGKSLVTQSHGQGIMAYFENRYKIKGLYFLDEPETALSPRSQIALLNLIIEMSRAGHAQFIIASHSPILLGCPGARIYNLEGDPISLIDYEDTDYFRIYRGFMNNRAEYIQNSV